MATMDYGVFLLVARCYWLGLLCGQRVGVDRNSIVLVASTPISTA
jgi:hypothetical protein